MKPIQHGETNVSVVIRIIDSTDGTPEQSVTSASGGLALWYRREAAAKVELTESDLSALTDAHSDGGMLHIDDGYYRVDIPDAAFASGVDGVMIGGAVTGMVVIGVYVPLMAYDPQDATRLGLTALPNADADAAGGLAISDAGGLDLDAMDTNVSSILTDTAEIGAAGAGLTAVPWNASWDAEVQSECNDALVATGLDHLFSAAVVGADVTDNSAMAMLVSASATADWDDYVNTTDSLQAQRDNVGTAVGADISADVAAVKTDTAAVLVDTADMQPKLGTPAGADISADIATVDTVVDAVKVKTDSLTFSTANQVDANPLAINSNTNAAVRLALSAGQIIPGTVDTVTNTHTPTTTEFQCDDITEATADHFNGRIVIFTSGVLAGQATDITDYEAVGGIGQFTVTAMTEAPSNNDTLVII